MFEECRNCPEITFVFNDFVVEIFTGLMILVASDFAITLSTTHRKVGNVVAIDPVSSKC